MALRRIRAKGVRKGVSFNKYRIIIRLFVGSRRAWNLRGSLDILDLLLTPLPQLPRELDVERLFVRNYDACKCREVLKKITHASQDMRFPEIPKHDVVPTLPLSPPAAGAVPAYRGVIAP